MVQILKNSGKKKRQFTPGEKRVFDRLSEFLEDDYLCWHDVPVGKRRLYPDYIILHPNRGLLFLEVKDWSLNNILSMTPETFDVNFGGGIETRKNPLCQARNCAIDAVNAIKRDKKLVQDSGRYKGSLVFPWAYGVVLPNITRKQLSEKLKDDFSESVLPERLCICKDEMLPSVDPEDFQKKLWDMFNCSFKTILTLAQIDRIRAHIFPEIRIGQNYDLFDNSTNLKLPDIIKVMDLKQERLARSLGDGHRVIHGVAGSGKTMILGYRSVYLSKITTKPILVLCFNQTLGLNLKSYIRKENAEGNVNVYHFHEWCREQARAYNLEIKAGRKPEYERYVETIIEGMDKGLIPKEQYAAVLIDEGHDFKAEWLKLVVQMIDKKHNSFLLLYDDAQSIYKRDASINFSLSSVGIEARGRTTILKVNYRNTKEILNFAYGFAKKFIPESNANDDIPLVAPEMSGNSGPHPIFQLCQSFEKEKEFIAKCILNWMQDGIAPENIAVIFPANWMGDKLHQKLSQLNLPCATRRLNFGKPGYVSLLTRHSSKGLEFSHVIVMGLGYLNDEEKNQSQESKLLYVAMTRAKEELIVSSSKHNVYAARLEKYASHHSNNKQQSA